MNDWPQKGDSIRSSSGDERFHAQLDLGNWGFYPKAYLDAAKLVAEAIASGANPDVIGYPLMYLYRHYLELMLKELINLGRALNSSSDRSSYPDRHELDVLWKDARPLIEKYGYREGENKDDLEAVGLQVGEFASLDPDGETFRYPVTRFKKGRREKTMPSPLHLSLDQVAKMMERVDNFLTGAESAMDDLLKYQADVDSEAF